MSKAFDQQETGSARRGRTSYGDADAAADKGVKKEPTRPRSLPNLASCSPPGPAAAELLGRVQGSLEPPHYPVAHSSPRERLPNQGQS
jgi:hypothetical protein